MPQEGQAKASWSPRLCTVLRLSTCTRSYEEAAQHLKNGHQTVSNRQLSEARFFSFVNFQVFYDEQVGFA